MISRFKDLTFSQDVKHIELKGTLDALSHQICELKSENAAIRSDLTTLKERVHILESTANSAASQDADLLP